MLHHNFLFNISLIILAYIVGSISSAIVFSKLLKLPDPRSMGSKNPGTTNMLRLAGKKLAGSVLLCDVFKGFFIVTVAKILELNYTYISMVAIAVVMGHFYPIFFRFKGGKGVATSLGVILALSWPIAIFLLLVWIVVFAIWRISSLAALAAIASSIGLAVIMLIFRVTYFIDLKLNYLLIFLGVMVIIRHRDNIYKLWHNQETKI